MAAYTPCSASTFTTPEALGEALFFDTNLSRNRTQSCATCHAPGRAFTDPRSNAAEGAVSVGDDATQFGTRNTPSLTYATFTPDFHRDANGDYTGGFFLDGRAATLQEQAAEPITNPIEMALTDVAMLRERILENPAYVDAIRRIYGAEATDSPDATVNAVTRSIARFERTEAFAPFDAKYDRYLRGEAKLTDLEERGRVVFFSRLINCHSCHLLPDAETRRETFSNYVHHNIGVPANPKLKQLHGRMPADEGLGEHPLVADDTQRGKFKTPTLRNVAVTPPYMHNGVFKDLRTVMAFYNTYLIRVPLNPETGEPWGEAEVPDNISRDLLIQGQPMNSARIDELIAFLNTLTDRRYEHLLTD